MTLGSFDRAAAVAALGTRTFDVVIIGGGITGAGVALDAASRGLRTALVDAGDFASGTSSRSSKMIHGGLRYLDNGEISLVYEALAERQRLRVNAPHLVTELPFVFPVMTRDGLFPHKLARAFDVSLWTYDLTGGARLGRLHRRLSPADTLASAPFLDPAKVAGGFRYWDCRADDARLTLALARTAAIDHGATVANRLPVVGLDTAAGHDASGATGTRAITVDDGGRRFDIRARVVVNATGVWADDVRRLDEPAAATTLRPAKGTHVCVPWSRVRNDAAVVLPVRGDRRSVFVVPWGDRAFIGTTDTDYHGPLDDPRCDGDDIAYLLDAVNSATTLDLSPDDVTATWAGLRPLVAAATDATSTDRSARNLPAARTADLSRRHQVTTSPSGLVTVTGGKLTTYRSMAADTVDVVLDRLDDVEIPFSRRCRTRRLPLRGAVGLREARRRARLHPKLGPRQGQHLVDRYGAEADVVLAMIDARPDLAEPLSSRLPYLRAEAVYAARYEMAHTLDDVLSRRLRARLLDTAATAAAAAEVAALIADDLGWDDDRRTTEVERFHHDLASDHPAGAPAAPGHVAT